LLVRLLLTEINSAFSSNLGNSDGRRRSRLFALTYTLPGRMANLLMHLPGGLPANSSLGFGRVADPPYSTTARISVGATRKRYQRTGFLSTDQLAQLE
jgi:hypothetical protein